MNQEERILQLHWMVHAVFHIHQFISKRNAKYKHVVHGTTYRSRLGQSPNHRRMVEFLAVLYTFSQGCSSLLVGGGERWCQ